MPKFFTRPGDLSPEHDAKLNLARNAIREALPGVPSFSVFIFEEGEGHAIASTSNMDRGVICEILQACLDAYSSRNPATLN